MRNIPKIPNDAVRVVSIVFVFGEPKDKTRGCEERERGERKDVKRWRVAYVEILS